MLYLSYGSIIFYVPDIVGTNMANLRKFHRRNAINFYSKDPYFLCRKTLRNKIELRQDLYLSMDQLYFVFQI